MMSSYNITIYLPEIKKSYGFYYYFNLNSSFDDLLESFSYNFPDLKICPCYKIELYDISNNTHTRPNMKEKVYKYINSYYQFHLIRENNNCICDQLIKDNFWTPKQEIISKMNEYIKILEILKSEISQYKSKENKLWEQVTQLENENKKLKIENDELKKNNEIINKLKKQEKDHKNQLDELIIEKELLTKKQKENEKTNKNANFINFYDVIVDINSVKDISEGWEIKMNEKAMQKYEEFKKEEVIKIGVIGNANKGKSFLLSKISKIPLPSGTSIRTEGLSIKYPVLDKFINRNIVLLDSAGLETPVLKTKKELELNRTSTKTEEDENKEKDHFKEKSREKLITELFLQNYIINNSDILIIVVGILTYSEQKLLNRIRTEFLKARNNKNKAQKPLFIIHNLMTYATIEQVEEYIEDFLLKSATFDLAVGHKISTKEEEKKGVYYYETIKNQKIFHLIFAQEGSVAGNHYNNLTLDFLENSYQTVTNLTNYDVIETIKDSFVEISKDILEKTENPITKECFDNSSNNLIKLSSQTNGVTLKKCLIDELGFSNLKGNGFEPTYNCYKRDNKIIVRVEVSGNKDLKVSQEHNSSYNIIKVEGEKKKDKEPEKNDDVMFTNREFGKFSLDIPLSPEFCIKNSRPKIEDKKGLIIIEFELEESVKTGELKTKDEEEV